MSRMYFFYICLDNKLFQLYFPVIFWKISHSYLLVFPFAFLVCTKHYTIITVVKVVQSVYITFIFAYPFFKFSINVFSIDYSLFLLGCKGTMSVFSSSSLFFSLPSHGFTSNVFFYPYFFVTLGAPFFCSLFLVNYSFIILIS